MPKNTDDNKIFIVADGMGGENAGEVASCLAVSSAMVYLNDNFDKEDIVVIIDAGHGGIDGGTQSADGTLEKDINLKIALKLNDLLQNMGVETVLIRDSDISVHDESAVTIREKKVSDIHNRLNVVESTENAVLVSIHQNYFTQPISSLISLIS